MLYEIGRAAFVAVIVYTIISTLIIGVLLAYNQQPPSFLLAFGVDSFVSFGKSIQKTGTGSFVEQSRAGAKATIIIMNMVFNALLGIPSFIAKLASLIPNPVVATILASFGFVLEAFALYYMLAALGLAPKY